MINFDLWSLNRLEKFAQKTQRDIGIDCFLWAKICVILFALLISCNAFFVQYYSYPLKGWWVSSVLFFFLFVALTMWNVTSLTERTIKNAFSHGLGNFLKLQSEYRFLYIFGDFIISILCWIFSDIIIERTAIFAWLGISGSCMFPLWLYFVSCDPLPPAKSRVREWLESVAKSAKEFLAPMPAPIPATTPPH